MSKRTLRKEISEAFPSENFRSVMDVLQQWGSGPSNAKSCSDYRAIVALSSGSMSQLRSLVHLIKTDSQAIPLLHKWNALRESIAKQPPCELAWFAEFVPAIARIALQQHLSGTTSHGSLVLRSGENERLYIVPILQVERAFVSHDRSSLLAPKTTEGLCDVCGALAARADICEVVRDALGIGSDNA